MDFTKTKKLIQDGKAILGIEFGSTRIKAVLIDEENVPIISGGYDWENQNVDGIWTYSMDEIEVGLQSAYADMAKNAKDKFNVDRKQHREYY